MCARFRGRDCTSEGEGEAGNLLTAAFSGDELVQCGGVSGRAPAPREPVLGGDVCRARHGGFCPHHRRDASAAGCWHGTATVLAWRGHSGIQGPGMARVGA